MDFFEITRGEKEKWINSKDLSKGFFKFKATKTEETRYDVEYYKQALTLEYYEKVKMPTMYSYKNNTGYKNNVFELLILNKELKLADTLEFMSLEWTSAEEYQNKKHSSLLNYVNKESNSYSKIKRDNYIIQDTIRFNFEESAYLKDIDECLTYENGFFDKNATLDEQEDFIQKIYKKNEELWREDWGEELNDTDVFSFLDCLDYDESVALPYVCKFLKAKGSKLSYL